MMKGRSKKSQRGFSVLLVVVLLAIGAMTAAIVMDTVALENDLMMMERHASEAAEVGDGGLHEILGDRSFELPSFATAGLEVSYTPSSSSPFTGTGNRYEATINLLRWAPVRETSMTSLRALVYEVHATGFARNGKASAEFSIEAFRLTGFAPGVVPPRIHAR